MMTQYQREMFKGAPGYIHHNAKILRRNMTEPERLLWANLKGKPWGVRFRRQHALAVYIVDFYCHPAKLVIEIDGKVHLDKKVAENDEQKNYDIEKMGLYILRFSNEEVLNYVDAVLSKIENFLTSHKIILPPPFREGQGEGSKAQSVFAVKPNEKHAHTNSTAMR
jgi:imidazole glycerol-phosphate synthase subunit HisF